jgi:hypothetical protein
MQSTLFFLFIDKASLRVKLNVWFQDNRVGSTKSAQCIDGSFIDFDGRSKISFGINLLRDLLGEEVGDVS